MVMFDRLKKLQDVPWKKFYPIWMPIGKFYESGRKVRLEIEDTNPYLAFLEGHRKHFYKHVCEVHNEVYSLIGNAGGKLDLRFGKKLYSCLVKRDNEAPSFPNHLSIGDNVNCNPTLLTVFWMQVILGCLWDIGYTFKGRVVKFIVPGCPQELLDLIYQKHLQVAIMLRLVDVQQIDKPYYVTLKRRSTSYTRILQFESKMYGYEDSFSLEGLVSVDGWHTVNFLALFEALVSNREDDFFHFNAFDCEHVGHQYLHRDIYMDEELIYHPELGKVSAPEWVFIKGRPFWNYQTEPMDCTPNLRTCLEAELGMPY